LELEKTDKSGNAFSLHISVAFFGHRRHLVTNRLKEFSHWRQKIIQKNYIH